MTNPSRKKGSAWEVELLDHLRPIWPHVERAPLKGTADCGDFLSCNDWLLEAKNVTTPHFLDWARNCRAKASRYERRWAILWHGNRNTDRGQPLVVLELATFLELAHLDHQAGYGTPPSDGKDPKHLPLVVSDFYKDKQAGVV